MKRAILFLLLALCLYLSGCQHKAVRTAGDVYLGTVLEISEATIKIAPLSCSSASQTPLQFSTDGDTVYLDHRGQPVPRAQLRVGSKIGIRCDKVQPTPYSSAIILQESHRAAG